MKAFLDSVLDDEKLPRRSATFTLTAAVPAETGSLHGWRILNLVIPGRWVSSNTVILPYDERSPPPDWRV